LDKAIIIVIIFMSTFGLHERLGGVYGWSRKATIKSLSLSRFGG